jgi:hypothetical protein
MQPIRGMGEVQLLCCLFVNRAWGRTAVTFSSLRVSVPVLCTHTLGAGAVVADDVRLMEGEILLDQSMLTGESIPIATLEPTISPRSLRFN